MDNKRAKLPDSMVSLPIDIFMIVVFFIPQWSAVVDLLDALRPANDLGPLEHLLKLNSIQWQPEMEWTWLNLTRMKGASRIHLAKLAKYFPRVIVNDETDLDWCQKHMDRSTPIHYIHVSRWVDAASLKKWADFRITSIHVHWHSHDLGGVFSYLEL
ncbi:hypothetical protein LEN26_002956 [Aphanomyces euteiches]|nr:hypothetical protein LEN26_017982 [Aphanomyces euteiches]KAH9158470.1 hypothetical protein LEN26_002956 [Aphanomyces euteiches]